MAQDCDPLLRMMIWLAGLAWGFFCFFLNFFFFSFFFLSHTHTQSVSPQAMGSAGHALTTRPGQGVSYSHTHTHSVVLLDSSQPISGRISRHISRHVSGHCISFPAASSSKTHSHGLLVELALLARRRAICAKSRQVIKGQIR